MDQNFSGVMSEEMLEGNHIPTTAKSISSEVEMWAAVIMTAWNDAFLASDVWLKNSDRSCEPDLVRAEARRWLLLDFGTFKSDREEVCEMANIDVVRSICALLDELAPAKNDRPHDELIDFVQDRPGHDLRYAVDAGKIERDLGWRPDETFASGLRHTVTWYLANRDWWQQILDGQYAGERLGRG